MKKNDLQKVDAFLEKILRALGQMDQNDRTGKWEMQSSLRDELVYEGYWDVQALIKTTLDDK